MLTEKDRARMLAISTNTISDAIDALGLHPGATCGVHHVYEGCKKIVGEAVTVKIGPSGETPAPSTHLCSEAIALCQPGDIIVVDNGGDRETSCWGGLLANCAQMKQAAGVVVDGAVRDVDNFFSCGFPVYARDAVMRTSRGRIMVYETNGRIQFCGVRGRPGDIVMADRSGVVIVPKEHFAQVLAKAEDLEGKESSMMSEVQQGGDMMEVDAKYDYVNMLKKK